jgi:cell division inhibitor SulA/protein ImuA
MSAALAEVLARSDIWRGDRCASAPWPTVSSGFSNLDAELPGGGWPRGALIELLADGSGLGEVSLLLPTLRTVRETGGWSLLVAPPHPLHAPAWAAAGADLSRLAVVSPASERDALWAMEQALASGAPGLVLGWASYADARALRRLQVAAVSGNVLALLFRPLRVAREASPAPLRLALASGVEGRLSVQIFKRRGPPLSAPLELVLPRPARSYSHGRSLARHSSAVTACA